MTICRENLYLEVYNLVNNDQGLFTPITNRMKPLIKWSGGKSSEIIRFRHYYPREFETVIEPFVGGGAVFFDLNHKKNVISDVHGGLINFYQQIKEGNAPMIYDIVLNFELNDKAYYKIRDEFTITNEVEQAARFYYLRKTCFRGMLRYNKNGKFNIPFGKYDVINIEDLNEKNREKYEKLFKNTDIRLASFEDIFEEFNDESNFMFLDPPYDSEFTNYGYCEFDRNHHRKLAEYFKSTKNKCLLIIGHTDFISDLYKDFIVHRYHKKYKFKIYSGRVGDEIDNDHLVIKNY